MTDGITRRAALAGMMALAAAPRALAQAATPDPPQPLIIRPEIYGVDPRYAAYASAGPYLHPSTPITVRTKASDVVVFQPSNLPKARYAVFSHGALADPLTYRDLIWQWVSHGFVVAAPLHADAVIESGPTLRKTRAGTFSEWPISALLEDPAAWRERVAACACCLDDVDLIAAATGIEILTDRTVIAGHGYGAYVAQLLLGATVVTAEGKRLDFADRRFFSGIAMSPQGPGVMGFDAASWKQLASPLLYLIAENDLDFTGQPAAEKAKAYLLAKPGYKHIGLLKHGSANTFTGAQASDRETKLFEVVLAMTTAFLEAYAYYDPAAFGDMTTEFFERMSLGMVDEGKR